LTALSLITLAAYGNPAMKEILRPLYEDEEEEEAAPVYVVTFNTGEAGGAAPAARSAIAGTAVVLPGAGGMTAPPGRPVLTGWHDGAALRRPGAAYTVLYPVTLTAQWDSVDNVLAAAPGGTAANPVSLALALDLGTIPSTAWQDLLQKIANAGKYVALDLSACALPGGLFDPGSASESLITALTLPDAATAITGSFTNFHFIEVHGANINAIGNNVFSANSALATVDLPKAETIGIYAFSNCVALATVTLPAATDIGNAAFAGCTALTTLDLPMAESIGMAALQITGTGPLTVTLGSSPPTMGTGMFSLVTPVKPVTVKVPSTAAYGTTLSVSDSDATECWANGFRGAGWNGTAFTGITSDINQDITVTITDL
jgi:hypothetical protein